jgi:hypothetical protein
MAFLNALAARGQFHQCSTCSFYVRKFCAQLFCAYILGLYFTGARLLMHRMLVKLSPALTIPIVSLTSSLDYSLSLSLFTYADVKKMNIWSISVMMMQDYYNFFFSEITTKMHATSVSFKL